MAKIINTGSFEFEAIEAKIETLVFSEKLDFTQAGEVSVSRDIKLATSLSTNLVSTGLAFHPVIKNGLSVFDFKKYNSQVMFYTAQNMFMESNRDRSAFLSQVFASNENKNIIILKEAKTIIAKDAGKDAEGKQLFTNVEVPEYTYALNVDFESIPRGMETAAKDITERAAKDIKFVPDEMKPDQKEEYSFIASMLEKNAIAYYVEDTISKKLLDEKANIELSATTVASQNATIVGALVKAILIKDGTEEEILAAGTYFGIHDLEQSKLFIKLCRADMPVLAIKNAINSQEIISIRLARMFNDANMSYAPIIETECEDLASVQTFLGSDDLYGFKKIVLAAPKLTKEGIDEGINKDSFLFPYAEGDESIGLTMESTISVIRTVDLYGTYGAASIRMNAITKNGVITAEDLTDSYRGGKYKFLNRLSKGIANKSVSKVDLESSEAKHILFDLMSAEGGSRASLVRSPFNDRYVYAFTMKGQPRLSSGFSRKAFEDSKLSDIIDLIPTRENFFLKTMVEPEMSLENFNLSYSAFKTAKEISRGLYFSRFSRDNTEKSLDLYRSHVADKTPLSPMRIAASFEKIIKETPSTTISGSMSVANISPNKKTFPDILHPMSKVKLSLKDIANNPILATRYLQLPGFSETIAFLMDINGMSMPATSHFILDLVNTKNNELHESKKDFVISNDESMGILNYKYMPPFIDISSKEAKAAFIDIVMKTIHNEEPAREIGEIKLDKSYEALIEAGDYVILKTVPSYKEGEKTFQKKEVFTIADKNLTDIATVGVSPLHVFKTLKDEGILNIKNRTSSVEMKASSVNKIFDAIDSFSEYFFSKYKTEHLDDETIAIAKKIATIVVDKNKSDLTADGKRAIYTGLLKDKGIAQISKEIMGEKKNPRNISFEALKDASALGVEIILSDELKNIEEFLEKHFYGKEEAFIFGKGKTTNKQRFNAFFANTDYGEPLWGRMTEVAMYDRMLYTATIKIFEMLSLKLRIDVLKERGTLTLPAKNAIINAFLVDNLGLSPHQFRETKGFVAMHMEGLKNTEMLMWEMRTGKTRAVLAMQMLMSLVEKEDSIFFVQNKNFDDIIMQAWDMNPLLVSEMAVFIGEQSRFNIKNYSTPVPLSKSIFPNIPIILKRNLKNPIQGSSSAPADILSSTFINDFEMIREQIENLKKEEIKDILVNAVRHDFPDLESLCSIALLERDDAISTATAVSILYVTKLAKDGFIDNNKEIAKKIIKAIFTGFLTKTSGEVDIYRTRKHGGIIFAGKQYIDSFSAKVKENSSLGKIGRMSFSTPLELSASFLTSSSFTNDFKSEFVSRKGAKDIKEQASARDREIDAEHNVMLSFLKLPDEVASRAETSKISLPMPILSSVMNSKAEADQKAKIIREIFEEASQKYSAILSKKADKFLNTEDAAKIFKDFGAFESNHSEFEYFVSTTTEALMGSIREAILAGKSQIENVAREEAYPGFLLNENDAVYGTTIDISRFDLIGIIKSKAQMAGIDDDQNFASWYASNYAEYAGIAGEVSMAAYKMVIKTMFQTNLNRSASAKTLKSFGEGQVAKTVRFSFDLVHGAPYMVAPSRSARIKGAAAGVEFIIEKINLQTKINSQQSPHVFVDTFASPRKIEVAFGESFGTTITIKAISVIDQDGVEKVIDKDASAASKSMSSAYYWEATPNNEIVSSAIDEVHKNTSGKRGFQAKGLLDTFGEMFPNSSRIIGTGTPLAGLLPFSKLIETISGAEGVKFSASILRYCGNYKFKNDFVAEIYHTMNIDKDFSSIIAVAAKSYTDAKAMDRESGSLISFGLESEAVANVQFESIWTLDTTKKMFEEGGALSDSSITKQDARKAFELVMESTAREIASQIKKTHAEQTEEQTEEDSEEIKGLEWYEEALWKAATKHNSLLTSIAPGFSSPISLSSYLGFVNGANPSIRRPSADIEYDVIDKAELEKKQGGNSIIAESEMACGKGVLAVEYALRRYRTGYHIEKTKQTIMSAFTLVTDAARKTPSNLGLKSVQNATELLNRSQVSVEDSAEDIYEYYLNHRKMPTWVSQDKINIVKNIMKLSSEIIGNWEKFAATRNESSANGLTSFTVHGDDGSSVELSTEQAMEMSFMHENIQGISVGFESATTSKSKQAQKLIRMKDGLPYRFDSKSGSESDLVFRVPLSVEIDARFPSVKVNYNISNRDDKSILEVFAFCKKTKEIAQGHIDSNLSLRLMTTRVAITEAAFVVACSSALDRKDTDNIFNVVVNATDKRIENFIKEVFHLNGQMLKEARVKVWVATPDTINTIFEEINDKNEKMSVVSNYESLAEGYNMEFIDIGMYLGAVDKTAAAIQSFARQTGFNRKKSSFYLGNGGHSHLLGGQSLKKGRDLLDIINEVCGYEITEKNGEQVFSKLESSLTSDGFSLAKSYNIPINTSRYIELLAYEHFMNGALVHSGKTSSEELKKWSSIINSDITIDAEIVALGEKGKEEEHIAMPMSAKFLGGY
jgi:hypothetical protein